MSLCYLYIAYLFCSGIFVWQGHINLYFVRPNFSCSVPLISEGQVRSQLVLHWHCKLMHNSGCTIYEDEWHTWIKLLLLHINNHFPEVIILGVWNVCWYGENVMLCFNAMSCNVPLEGLLSFSHRELRYKPVEKNQIQKWYQVRNMFRKSIRIWRRENNLCFWKLPKFLPIQNKKLQANTMLIQMRIRHCYCDTGAFRLERSIVLD